jgi:hypothetical protein
LISVCFSNNFDIVFSFSWLDSQGNVVSKLSASVRMQMDSFDPYAETKGPKAKKGKT